MVGAKCKHLIEVLRQVLIIKILDKILPIFSFFHLCHFAAYLSLRHTQGNHGKYLKGLHSEQLAKLQLKNQHECELLEDIRQFTIKRSAIEKSYSESLLKISSLYLNKKMVCIPEIKLDGSEKW